MLDGPYKVDGARQGSHNPRVSLEGYFIFEIGGICCCWWCWFEDGVNKRVACACAQNQTAKGSCNFGTTPVRVGKLTWNGVLYSRHSANDLFSKRIFNMKQASVHYGLTFTSDDVVTGILFSGYFAFSVLLVDFFFYRVLDF